MKASLDNKILYNIVFLKLEIEQTFLLISKSTFEEQRNSLGLKVLLKLEFKKNELTKFKIQVCSAAAIIESWKS